MKEYKKKLVIILDNAKLHTVEKVRQFFSNRGFMGITLPQYTPEWNPIELLFRNVKNRIYRIPFPQ